MIGKYEFSNENVEKILIFFEPALHTLDVLVDEQKKDLKSNVLLASDFEKVYNYFKKMEFLDEFNEWKDMILIYYEEFWNKLITLNKKNVVDRHQYLPNILSIIEITEIIDSWIVKSFDSVENGGQVLALEDCLDDLKKILNKYCKLMMSEKNKNFNSDQIKEILNLMIRSENYTKIDKSIEIMLSILEEKNFSNQKINDIFDENSMEYWIIYKILVKMSIISGFALFLKSLFFTIL